MKHVPTCSLFVALAACHLSFNEMSSSQTWSVQSLLEHHRDGIKRMFGFSESSVHVILNIWMLIMDIRYSIFIKLITKMNIKQQEEFINTKYIIYSQQMQMFNVTSHERIMD